MAFKKYSKKSRPNRKAMHTKKPSLSKSDWQVAKRVELQSGVHNFKEKIFDNITVTPNASGTYFNATDFMFNQAPDYTSYARIFDAYQITGVKIKYILNVQNVGATTTLNNLDATSTALTTYTQPSIVLVYSPGDAVTPTSVAQMLEYKGARLRRMNNGIAQIFIKPKPLIKLYNGTLDTDYKLPNFSKNTWISTTETDLQHYALKEAWTGLSPNVVYNVQRVRTYYFKFKIPK